MPRCTATHPRCIARAARDSCTCTTRAGSRDALERAVLDVIKSTDGARFADLDSGIRTDILPDARALPACLQRLKRRGLIQYRRQGAKSGWVLA